MVSDFEHLLMGLLTTCTSSLEKCLFPFLPTFKSDCLLFDTEFKSSLYILVINPLSDISFANNFFYTVGCLFYNKLNVFCRVKETINRMKRH